MTNKERRIAKAKPPVFGPIMEFIKSWPLHITTVILIGVVYVIAPQQLGLLAYKAALITLPTIIVYWISRWVLHLDVDKLDSGDLTSEDQWHLVLLICAAMLAAGLAA